MSNDELYDEAMKAITALFSDMSVSKATCRTNLNSLIGEIKTLIESLDVGETNNE